MRRLHNCIFYVIFIAILICGWNLDHQIATARVADQLPSSPDQADSEGHEMVDYIQTNRRKELIEITKNIQRFDHDLHEVLDSKVRSINKGHNKSQVQLIASIATTIGGSLFVVAIVLLLCANSDQQGSPQKDETLLLCESESPKNDISETKEVENVESFHSPSIKLDVQEEITLASNPENDVSVTSRSFDVMKPPAGRVIIPKNDTDPPPPPPPPRPPPPSNLAPPPPSNLAPPPASSNGPAPPPPPNLRAPPPPPMKGGRGPPTPPVKVGGPRAPPPIGGTAKSNATKLKPFFWDKVLASPKQTMVWDEIRAGSFQFNEEMIATLFGYNPDEKKGNNDRKDKKSSLISVVHLIESKKAQNLSILLKALNVTTREVRDALMEGTELPIELLQTLLKMAPTTDEELKIRLFNGDLAQISPGERFLKALVDIPFAFKRMECILFMITLKEEVSSLKGSFATLEMASDKLRSSRLFMKLLEAVLKTGNRMNDGTYRGGAQAFKLDTLLKLADVKGKDGKTTLLHFVVQEIIRSEGIKVARAADGNCSVSSIKSDDFTEDAAVNPMENFHVLGLPVVSGLSTELEDIKKAALVDSDALTSTAAKLGHTLLKTKDFLNREMSELGEESRFYHALKDFVEESEVEITSLLREEKRIMDIVKKTVDYFHGNSSKDEGLRLFVIVRDFMVLLDKICADIQKTTVHLTKASSKDKLTNVSSNKMQQSSSTSSDHGKNNDTDEGSPEKPSETPSEKPSTNEGSPEVSSQEPHPQTSSTNEQLTKVLSQERVVEEMRQKLFPMIQGGQIDESSSSSSEDETQQGSTKGIHMEVQFQESHLADVLVSSNSAQTLDDSSSSRSSDES